jgi:hypothetical protein
MSVLCTSVSAAVLCVPGTAAHGLSVWVTPDRIVNTAMLRRQCKPAKTAYGLARTVKNECIFFCQQRHLEETHDEGHKDCPSIVCFVDSDQPYRYSLM